MILCNRLLAMVVNAIFDKQASLGLQLHDTQLRRLPVICDVLAKTLPNLEVIVAFQSAYHDISPKLVRRIP